jgi:phage-related protein
MSAVNSVTGAITRMANSVTGKLNEVMGGMGRMVSAVAGSILKFAVGIVQWIADRLKEFADWANEKLMGLADWIRTGLGRLVTFLQPVLDVLGKIAAVFVDLMSLPGLVLGRLWNMIPACIRNPFVNFLINQILKRIPIVKEIVEVVELWPRIQAEIMTILRMIFRDGKLWEALKRIFGLLLRALGIPPELLSTILQKAATAWDAVLDKPIAFLKNILRAMKQAFSQFFRGILGHLWFGVTGWIFGQLSESGIQPPTSWTDLRSVFRLVLQVLGITVEHIFELLARKLSPERVAQLRRAFNFLTGAWEWVSVAMNEGAAGIWRMLVQKLRDLGNMVLDAAISWIVARVTARVSIWLVGLLDPTGIMTVVNSLIALYRAIQTVMQYLRQILEMINRVLDSVINIARGVIGPAATAMEDAMHRAMPIVVAFLANQVGLGSLGTRVRELVEAVRERVDAAILWLIDQALRLGQAVLNALGLGQGGQPAAPGRPAGAIGKVVTFTAAGEEHRLWIERRGQGVVVMVASDGKPVTEELSADEQLAAQFEGAPRTELTAAISQARESNTAVTNVANTATGTGPTTGTTPTPAAPATANPAVESAEMTEAEKIKRIEEIKAVGRFGAFRKSSPFAPKNYMQFDSKKQKFAPAGSPSTPYDTSSEHSFMMDSYRQFVSVLPGGPPTPQALNEQLTRAIKNKQLSKSSAQKYAIVDPPPPYSENVVDTEEEAADADLKAAVAQAGDVVKFMIAIAEGRSFTRPTKVINRAELERLWNTSQTSKEWLGGRFRAKTPGHHEWIATDLMVYVIGRAADSVANGIKASQWIELQNELRTDTSWVVFKPDKATSEDVPGRPTTRVLQGHPGALSYTRASDGREIDASVGSPGFHNELVGVFRNKDITAQAALTQLKGIFERWVWNNEAVPSNLNPTMKDSHGMLIKNNPSGFVSQQQERYGITLQMFNRLIGKYGNM